MRNGHTGEFVFEAKSHDYSAQWVVNGFDKWSSGQLVLRKHLLSAQPLEPTVSCLCAALCFASCKTEVA